MTQEKNEPTQLIKKRQYKKGETRRQDIMAAGVKLLALPQFKKFTTKEIAAEVGVSEACLYRHFPSKASILLGIVDFCDASFVMMSQTVDKIPSRTNKQRVLMKIRAFLDFAEANPGITRLLTAEALAYEDPRVLDRMRAVLTKAQGMIKQSLRDAIASGEIRADTNVSLMAAVFMSYVEGSWSRFSLSGFRDRPTSGWPTTHLWFEKFFQP